MSIQFQSLEYGDFSLIKNEGDVQEKYLFNVAFLKGTDKVTITAIVSTFNQKREVQETFDQVFIDDVDISRPDHVKVSKIVDTLSDSAQQNAVRDVAVMENKVVIQLNQNFSF